MRYQPPQPEGTALGPAEMIVGFIGCIIIFCYILSLVF